MLPLRPARLRGRPIAACIAAVVLLFLAPSVAVAGPPASLPGGADSASANAIGPSLGTAIVAGAGQPARHLHPHSVLPGPMLFALAAIPAPAGLRPRRRTPDPHHLPEPQAAPAPRPPRGPPAAS